MLDVRSKMDSRLQGAGLAAGIIFAELPNLFGPNYTGNQASFVSSWNTIISAMQYLVIASLVLVILGIIRRGPIGRPSAWIQMFISFGLGSWMFLGLTFLGRDRLGPGIGTSAFEIRRRQFVETSEPVVASVVASVMLVFGLLIIFAAASTLILIAAAGVIALSATVFVLEVARQTNGPR